VITVCERIFQVVHPSDAEEFYGKQRQEYILDDDDCPLDILLEMPPTTGLFFV